MAGAAREFVEMNEIVYRHGDKISIMGRVLTLNLKDAPTILEGTDDPGACVEHETIYVRLDVGNPKETLLHEIQEETKWALLTAAQDAMEELLHEPN